MSRIARSRGASGRRSGGGGQSASAGPGLLGSYLQRSQRPLTCLLFLMPLIVLYEVGTRMYATDSARHTELRNVAFLFMRRFFHFFGATGHYMPALAVAGILLTWHIARRDPWQLDIGAAAGMLFESVLLSMPLFLLNALSMRYVPLYGVTGASIAFSPPARAVFSLGAGIYEELVFRLIAFTLLSILLIDVLRIRKGWAILLMVCASSILFASYHYLGLEERFSYRTFMFRTAAGIYFGLVFFARGFGVTAGSHVAYDMLLVLLGAMT
jgi:hypothetical protein